MSITSSDGFLWFKDEYPDDWIGFNHEAWVPEYLQSLLPDDGVFCDVGAHVGRYTIRLARAADRVYAIEPFPQGLFANLSLNSLQNVEVFRCAASDSPTRMDSVGWGGSTTLIRSPEGSIYGTPIDDMLLGHIDLMKIDVEGQEGLVLAGAHKVLRESLPILFIEMHTHTAPYFSDPEEVYKELRKADYTWETAGNYNEQWYLEARPN